MCRSTRPASEAGFTLIEVLVALAVFGLAAMALLNLSGQNALTAAGLQDRTLAGVVADNRAVEALIAARPPTLGQASGAEQAGGRVFLWSRRVSRTADPDILRIDVLVVGADRSRALGGATVFRSAR